MLLPDESSSSTSCSNDEALLQVLFHPDGAVTVQQNGGMTIAITYLSNGTTVDSLHFRKGDAIRNVSTCLARRTTTTSGCYGLELVNAWPSYNVSIVYDGITIKDSQYQQFPYYVTPRSVKGSSSSGNSAPRYGVVGTSNSGTDDDDEDEVVFAPYESNVTFVEIAGDKSSSSCIPTCNTSSQDLYTVQTFAGNQGDGSFGWRLEQQQDDDSMEQVNVLMGCGGATDRLGDGADSDPCVGGGVYRVRIDRSCLPKSAQRRRRRFVMGHPNSIPAEPTPIRNGTAMNMSSSLWEGHYPPMFQVSVNDVVVANGTVTTFVAIDIEHTDTNGSNLSTLNPCPANTSLFELFQYSTVQYEYRVQDLTSGNVVSTSMNATSSNNGSSLATSTPLRYVRQCIDPTGCYDLTVQASASSTTLTTTNSSSTTRDPSSGISTQAVLGGIYYTNAFLRYVPFHVTLGDTCTRHQVCPLVDESLLRIDIHMSDALEEEDSYVPSYYCAWSVFRSSTGGSTSSSLESIMPEESMSYFSNGYPGGGGRSDVRHYMCVPTDDDQGEGELTFGMLHSVPMDVEWSITRDGVPLECRSTTQVESTSGGYIVTPLDGSCPPNRTTIEPGSSSPPQPPSSMLATGLFVGIVGGILAMVAVLAAILVSKSNAGIDESNVRRLPGWPSPAGADRRRRQSLRRRFSTRSNGTESMSVSDDDDCNVGVRAPQREPTLTTTAGVEGGGDGDA